MDDLFLYNHIKQAIKQRKQFSKDTEQENFAQSYCRREMMKKKLNVSTSNSNATNKMKSLMKNFSHVETYIDLNELLFSINQIRVKQLAEKKLATIQQKRRESRISRIQDIEKMNKAPLSCFSDDLVVPTVDPIEALKDKFRSQITQKIKRICQHENREMNDMLNYLEGQSHLKNCLFKNNSTNYLSYLNQELQRIEKTDQLDGETYSENNKIFNQLTASLGQHQFEKPPQRTEFFRSTNLNSKQKKQENLLLHKISTFLQIALENQHKEKWATKQLKKFRSTHGSFRFKKDKDERSKFFLKGINMENDQKQKEIFQNIQESQNSPSNISKKSTVRRNQNLINRIKSEQRNIFGKRSLDKGPRTMNQPRSTVKTVTNWAVPEGNKREQKENIQIFKRWGTRTSKDERKTAPAPVNHEYILDDFTRTMTKEQERRSKEKEVTIVRQKSEEAFLTEMPTRKDFALNKRKRTREYAFLKPRGDSRQSKTFEGGSSYNSEMEEPRSTMKSTKFSESEEFGQLERGKDVMRLKQKSSMKSPKMVQDLSKGMKKSQSVKSSTLSQNFTFKKRGKKQQIINKLQSFIEQINIEQKMSKAQNEYYDLAINHLHDLSKTTYKNYEPQALAGYEEISDLKKFVNSINPSLRKNKSKKKTEVRCI